MLNICKTFFLMKENLIFINLFPFLCIPDKDLPAFQRECSVCDSRYLIIANYNKSFLK
jgi:hypothetical protein